MSEGDNAGPFGAARPRACPDAEEHVRALVDRLRDRRDDLAAALGGRALSVEVQAPPSLGEPVRLGFGGEGLVSTLSPANPLSLAFSPNVVIRGTVGEVLDILTADEPLPGSVHLPDPEAWPRYARVHRIVAPEVRAIIRPRRGRSS